MNRDILQRTRVGTVLTAAVLCVPLGLAVSWLFAIGMLATALWAVAGFWFLERLLRAALQPPGTRRNVFAIVLWGVAKLAVYAVAVWVLLIRPFPALSHVVGLTLLLILMVVQGAVLSSKSARHPQLPPLPREDGPGTH
ncbi:MAG: hypothetical protein R6X25_09635 [Candidatus Krumholzibacteriia bacterium]